MAVIPGVDPKYNQPTQKQIDVLKKHNLWKEGLTFAQASELMDKLLFGSNMKPGIHKLRLKGFEDGKKADGNYITDKNGNPCVRMVFMNAEKHEIDDLFFYPKSANTECKGAWKLAALKAALGMNVAASISSEQFQKEKFYIFGKVNEVHYVDATNRAIMVNGVPKISVELDSKYWPVGYNDGKGPKIDGDPKETSDGSVGAAFIRVAVDRSSSAAAPQAAVADDFDSDPGEETQAQGAAYQAPVADSEDAF